MHLKYFSNVALVERSGWIGNVVSFVSVFLKVIFDLLFSSD